MTVGVWHDPWPAWRARSLRRYRSMVEFKANPRDEAYMRALFAERHPEALLRSPDEVGGATRVVLLYPDATGIGWSEVERRVRAAAGPGAEIVALNGRRREMPLDGRTRRALALRRLLEVGLVGEAAATLLFLAATPVLLAWDLLRGRR